MGALNGSNRLYQTLHENMNERYSWKDERERRTKNPDRGTHTEITRKHVLVSLHGSQKGTNACVTTEVLNYYVMHEWREFVNGQTRTTDHEPSSGPTHLVRTNGE